MQPCRPSFVSSVVAIDDLVLRDRRCRTVRTKVTDRKRIAEVRMGRLDGKVAIITGAARGQGAAEARAFVAEGAFVLVADLLDEVGAELVADLGPHATYQHLDVTSPDDWSQALQRALELWGRLDVLVNNAGVVSMGTIEEQSEDDFRTALDVNLVGCWLGMKTVIPTMK